MFKGYNVEGSIGIGELGDEQSVDQEQSSESRHEEKDSVQSDIEPEEFHIMYENTREQRK